MKNLNCLQLLLLTDFAIPIFFSYTAPRVEEPVGKPREEIRSSEPSKTSPPREYEYVPPRETVRKEPSRVSQELVTGQAEPPVSYTIETKQPTIPQQSKSEIKPTISSQLTISISKKPLSEFETLIPATQPKQEWEPLKNPTNRADAEKLADKAIGREQTAQQLVEAARARGDTIAEQGAQRLLAEAKYDKTVAQIIDNEFTLLDPRSAENAKIFARSKLTKARQEHAQAAKELGIAPRTSTVTIEPGPIWDFVVDKLSQSLTTPQEAGKRWWKRLVDSFTKIFTRKAEKAGARKTIDLDTALRIAQSEMQKYKSSWKGSADALAQDKQFLTLQKNSADALLNIALDNLENYKASWKGTTEALSSDQEFKELQRQVAEAQQQAAALIPQVELSYFNDVVNYYSHPVASAELSKLQTNLSQLNDVIDALNNPEGRQLWEEQETNQTFFLVNLFENPYSVLLLENNIRLPRTTIKDQFEALKTFLSEQLAGREANLGKNSPEYARALAKYQIDIERLNEAYTILTTNRSKVDLALVQAKKAAKSNANEKFLLAPTQKAALEQTIKDVQNDAYTKVKEAHDRLLQAVGKTSPSLGSI